MGDEDIVDVAVGNHEAGLVASNTVMFRLGNVQGVLQCVRPLECFLNGSHDRTVFRIDGTGSGALTVRGMKITNGISKVDSGGGMYVKSGDVHLEACAFENNHANKLGGALYVTYWHTGAETVLAGVSFANNTADSDANDIYSGGGGISGHSVAIRDHCEKMDGKAVKGEALDITGVYGGEGHSFENCSYAIYAPCPSDDEGGACEDCPEGSWAAVDGWGCRYGAEEDLLSSAASGRYGAQGGGTLAAALLLLFIVVAA
jgi:predicted outer membrane repeat protein